MSQYDRLIKHYENNKEKPYQEWLSFDKLLTQGKQGIVGLFDIINEEEKHEKPIKCIFKMSQGLNYLVKHEYVIMEGLNELSSFVPHFSRVIGIIKCKVEPDRKASNPFLLKRKYSVEKEVLLCEYIENSYKLYHYIKNSKIDENVLYGIMKNILMTIGIAQKKKKFTHYDLHSNNIMVKKCNKDLVFLYVIDENNQFCVPTFGHRPVLIDYGFSYIQDMEDSPLWISLAHTDVGFMSDRFDWVQDPKLFLLTVSDEIKEMRKTSKAKKLRRIVRNMFFPLKVDTSSGWDNTDDKGAVDYVLQILETYNKSSKIFRDSDVYAIDILQSLIILPLQEQDYSQIGKSFKIFVKEWVKIENEISNEFYNLYILKELVDVARTVRPDFMRQETKDEAVTVFRHGVYDAINKVTTFCKPKKIDFEIMLLSLLTFAENMEGLLYDIINMRMEEKEKEYNKMPLQNVEQMYAVIDINIKDDYVYNENTKFYIIDLMNNTNETFLLKYAKDEIDNINKLNAIGRGCYCYDIIKTKTK